MFTRLLNAIRLYRHAFGDARTPLLTKALPFVAVLYLFWPIDIIPDFIPILGQLDDVTVIIMLLTWAFKLIPSGVQNDAQKDVIDVEPKP